MKFALAISLALFAIAQAFPASELQDGGKLKIPEKCSDVLSEKVCLRLDNVAKTLKLKSEEVKNAVVEAYKQGKTKSEELYKKAKELLQDKVLSKKCEDLTTAENCQKLRKMAADLKIQADKVAEFVMREIANLKTKECEDFLDAAKCKTLTDLTNKLKIKVEKVREMMVAAYLDAKDKSTEMLKETYNKIKTYVMSTKCEDVLNPDVCSSFRKYAEKTKVGLPILMETAVNVAKKGVAVGKEMIKKVYDIVDYFYDCTDIFDEKSCQRMKSWAASLKITAQEFEKAVKKYVRIAIERGTTIYTTIKEFVKNKIICRFSSNCVNSDDIDNVSQDELAFGIFDDFKAKMLNVLNEKFPDLEDELKAKVTEMITKARNLFELMKNLARKIKTNATNKLMEVYKKLMLESVF